MSNIEHGRFERSLSGLTAVSALVTGAEVYLEHYKASFGNKWMWSPIVLTPPLVIAGIGGVSRKPGGWKLYSYNLPMGPPISAPGMMAMVGGMGLLAAVLRREK